VFVNEYNVLQWSEHPLEKRGPDPYANWYRQYVDALRDAGGAVGGIGIQYYALNDAPARRGSPHSPARMMGAFQNLSVTGLPLSLTEFGVQSKGSTEYDAARFLEDTARMSFGTPQMNTFMVWGFWEKEMWDQANRGAMVDANWNLLAPGRTWKALMAEWDTDVTAFAGPDGTITFRGFYGDYDIIVNDTIRPLTLVKGRTAYTLAN
jgi:GH35 family endo-1,4-beta-xylanase